MTRSFSVLLLCALAPITVLTGCGSSGSAPSKPSSAQPSSTTRATGTLSTAPLDVKVRQAIAACKKQVAALTYIPASEQPAAKADCEGIKTGNISPLRATLKKACEQEVLARVPAAQQAAATTACKKVY